jgi:hypothetical protein
VTTRYAAVGSAQRYRSNRPCPICGGWYTLPHGRRCWGFLSGDGSFARCTRSEYAGALDIDRAGGYAHRLDGPCRCGLLHDGALELVASYRQSTGTDDVDRTAAALRIWERTRPGHGSIVENYLRARALRLPVPPTIRAAAELRHGPSGRRLPAMVAIVERWGLSQPVAIHRTYLDPSGRSKADVEPSRMALGPIAGGAVRCAAAGQRLAVAEGIETALSLQMATGIPAWAVLGSSNMPGLVLPPLPAAAEIVIGADPDVVGMRAASRAAARWIEDGRRVRIAVPPAGLDFNAMLQQAVA